MSHYLFFIWSLVDELTLFLWIVFLAFFWAIFFINAADSKKTLTTHVVVYPGISMMLATLIIGYINYARSIDSYTYQTPQQYQAWLPAQIPKLQQGKVECSKDGLKISGMFKTTFTVDSETIRASVPVEVKYSTESRCQEGWFLNQVDPISKELKASADAYVSSHIEVFEDAIRPTKELKVSALNGVTLTVPTRPAKLPDAKNKEVKSISVISEPSAKGPPSLKVDTLISAQ